MNNSYQNSKKKNHYDKVNCNLITIQRVKSSIKCASLLPCKELPQRAEHDLYTTTVGSTLSQWLLTYWAMCWAAHRLHHALHDMLFHGTSARLLNTTLLSSTAPPCAAHALPRHQCEITQYHAAQQYRPTTRCTCSSTAPVRDYSIPRCSAVPKQHSASHVFVWANCVFTIR